MAVHEALGTPPAALVAPADMVVISLIKGICGPGGALLCGAAEDIDRANTNLRKIGAATFHGAGILAAAGAIALETMIDRLHEDISRAKTFAQGIHGIDGVELDLDSVQTNIVMADISASGLSAGEFLQDLQARGVKGHQFTDEVVRFTFHRHITDENVHSAVQAVKAVMAINHTR